MKSRFRQFLLIILIGFVGVIVGFIIYAYVILQLSLPVTDGTLNFTALDKPVEITYDQMGIPQVWAKTEHDGYFTLGYLHTSDRMFQMELLRRISQGRLSEILGDILLDIDISQRQMGHYRLAQKAIGNLSQENRNRLQAYCEGVNAYRRECRALPFEFEFLPTEFDDWTITDCLCEMSFQAWFSHELMSRDEFFLKLYDKLGPQKASKLLPRYPSWAPVTVPGDDEKSNSSVRIFNPVETLAKYDVFQRAVAASLLPDRNFPSHTVRASNAWVVASDKSISDQPMLASDPHLETTRLPQFWYYAGLHIEADSINVLGITVPGLPFFIMGHNFEAAWAFTAGGIDITEYYTEKINPKNKKQYFTSHGWKNFTIINDTIIIRNNEPEILEIKFTDNGPIVMDGADSSSVISLRWAGFDTDLNQTITNGFKLADVSGFEFFRRIVTGLGALNANWIFADTGGNIGYQLGTPVPVRLADSKNFPLEGWLPQNKWKGYYPLEKTPHASNPDQGWLATCNNKPAVDLPYDLPGNFFHNRILRISALLESKDIFSIEDMMQYQLDITDTSLLRWKNEVVGLLESIEENSLADTLRNWDGSTGTDSRETLLLNLFLNQLKKYTYEDELGNLSSGISTTWLEKIYKGNDTVWFDNTTTPDKIESRTETAKEALREALSLAGKKTWGKVHTLTMRHPLARIPLLSDLLGLSHGPWPWRGSGGTLNASYFRMDTDSTFSSIVGPSWRLVIDLGDIDGAMMVLPAGNSGNPVSPHFFDFNEMWQKGEYWNVPLSYEMAKEKSAGTLYLSPKEKSE